MGVSIRVFLIDDDDNVRKFPYARLNRLTSRERRERVPEFANRRIRYAVAVLETKDGHPERILNLDFLILVFDKNGSSTEVCKNNSFVILAAYLKPTGNKVKASVQEEVRVHPTSFRRRIHLKRKNTTNGTAGRQQTTY